MKQWNPDGPNEVLVPEGVDALYVYPVNEFIKRSPTRLVPKLDDGHSIKIPNVVAGPLAIDGADVAFAPRLRITGVKVYARQTEKSAVVMHAQTGKCLRDIDTADAKEGEHVVVGKRLRDLIDEFEWAEGRAKADADLMEVLRG